MVLRKKTEGSSLFALIEECLSKDEIVMRVQFAAVVDSTTIHSHLKRIHTHTHTTSHNSLFDRTVDFLTDFIIAIIFSLHIRKGLNSITKQTLVSTVQAFMFVCNQMVANYCYCVRLGPTFLHALRECYNWLMHEVLNWISVFVVDFYCNHAIIICC